MAWSTLELMKEVERLRLTRPELVTPGNEKTPYDIVLIGEQITDWDLQAIKPLMEQLGVRVTGVIDGESRPEEVVRVLDACLNVAGVGRPATEVAEKIRDDYQIPYVWASFLGLSRFGAGLPVWYARAAGRGSYAGYAGFLNLARDPAAAVFSRGLWDVAPFCAKESGRTGAN